MIAAVAACVSIYWLVIRGTSRLGQQARAWLVGGYAVIHLASWVSMDLAARADFRVSVTEMHSQGKARAQRELDMYARMGLQLNDEDRQRIEKRVHDKPHWSFWSFSPFPCLLVGCRSYTVGPLWGLGETWGYLFEGNRTRVIFRVRTWIS